jgi:hypothetical protein
MRAVGELDRRAGTRVDELGVHEAPGAEVHPVLRLALAPQGHADVPDPHRLGDPRPPAGFEHAAERGLAAARLAGHEDAADARAGEVGRLHDVCRVRGREHHRVGAKALDRLQQPLRAAAPHRDVAGADAVERRQGGARGERPGVVGRDDALAGGEAGRRVAARGAGHPVVEVGGRERDGARRAGRAARGVDADDLGVGGAAVGAERLLGGDRGAQLVLRGQREVAQVLHPAELRAGEPLAVERRVGGEVGDLLAQGRAVERLLVLPGPRLDGGLEHQGAS